MATSKNFFGLRRGSTKSLTFQVLDGKQITKDRVTEVKNPKTIAQNLQRMKLAPAQKFYAALNSATAQGVINHSFEGVAYHEPTRRAFMALAMSSKLSGPYVPKGVQTFIPAVYQIAKGSLENPFLNGFQDGSAAIPEPSEGATRITIQPGNTIDADRHDALLEAGIPEGAQISIVYVTENGTLYVPYSVEFKNSIGEIAPMSFGAQWSLYIDMHQGAVQGKYFSFGSIGGAVIISQQDASGKWLRSNSWFSVSDDIMNTYYTIDAMNAALKSYGADTAANSLNSDYFLNQATEQAFNGKVSTLTPEVNDVVYDVMCGYVTENGRVNAYLFTTDGTAAGQLIGTDGNPIADVSAAAALEDVGATGYLKWDEAYLAQAGF